MGTASKRHCHIKAPMDAHQQNNAYVAMDLIQEGIDMAGGVDVG